MKQYAPQFKNYLRDLAAKTPAPGGGSAAALAGCVGISLIEMAMQYSLKEGSKIIVELTGLRKQIFPAIDKDAQLFAAIMKAKPSCRAPLIKKSEALMISLGFGAINAARAAKKCEVGIKKSILSDFILGLDFLKICLKGAVLNLEGNAVMFGKASSYINTFKGALEKWPNC